MLLVLADIILYTCGVGAVAIRYRGAGERVCASALCALAARE